MEQYKIDRINELARKSKTIELSVEELAEQQMLRLEYIQAVRSNLRSQIDNLVLVDEQGNEHSVPKKLKEQ